MNASIKNITEARTYKELIFRTTSAVKELAINWKSNEEIRRLIMKLIQLKPEEQAKECTVSDKFEVIHTLGCWNHFSKFDLADLIKDRINDDTFLEYKMDTDPLTKKGFEELMELAKAKTENATEGASTAIQQDKNQLPEIYEPLKNSTWTPLPACIFHRPLWTNKKPPGLVKLKFCFNQILQLSKAIEEEYWGTDREILNSHLDYTFRQCIDEGKVMAFWIHHEIEMSNTSQQLEVTSEEEDDGYEDDLLTDYLNELDQEEDLNFPIDKKWKPPIIDNEKKLAAVILVWNTGLLSKYMQEMYCMMIPFMDNDPKEKATWYLKWFHPSSEFSQRKKFENTLGDKFYEIILKTNPPPPSCEGQIKATKDLNIPLLMPELLPKKVNYFKNAILPAVQYDPEVPLIESDINHEHFFQHIERYPLHLKDHLNDKQAFLTRIKAGIDRSLLIASRNPRIAVPFYSRASKTGELQLMIPLNLDYQDSKQVDCVAVLKLVTEKMPSSATNDGGNTESIQIKYRYQIRTIFTHNLAYNNARLVSKVDCPWLLSALPGKQQSAVKLTFKQKKENEASKPDDMLAEEGGNLYKREDLAEVVELIKRSNQPFTPVEIYDSSDLKAHIFAIAKMRPKWKMVGCKNGEYCHIAAHYGGAHFCAFAHTEEERRFWFKIREFVNVQKKENLDSHF